MTTASGTTSLTDDQVHHLSNAERDRVTVDLLVEAAAGDDLTRKTARDRAVELNLPLARYLANRYAGRGIAIEDLQQVASLGLLKAARGFSPERSTSFAAYAIPTIRGELRKHFRDAGWTVRPPRRIQELQAHIRAAEAELVQRLQRSPSVREIADELEVEIDEVLEATSVDSCFTPYSLDAPVPVDGGSERSVQADLGSWDPQFASAEARLVLGPAIRGLGERDRTVLRLRFVEGLTQQQIGEQVGVSQMQVSRILNRVLAQLRDSILGQAA
ncbi:SigB/SigF/SigG family RNA polymerase sigma factor [Nocardioides marmorisolisilvae]|uniref:SigB/SigF/SigG family RNA polymerase sigma factor n=1 Tax=Nocardioides marmorisolisilvae TaxID=1542737 RepID=A0A3N0DU46_9ACTN|nr:SigB/SigF/SigG family RNA polymerase sigma factor [Nocardioides marmorisolisilvae]RNL79149.1 SigB/SigF/SigG family RNA polymerase sigma factor [Nocardioides marmorisolisilvae]